MKTKRKYVVESYGPYIDGKRIVKTEFDTAEAAIEKYMLLQDDATTQPSISYRDEPVDDRWGLERSNRFSGYPQAGNVDVIEVPHGSPLPPARLWVAVARLTGYDIRVGKLPD